MSIGKQHFLLNKYLVNLPNNFLNFFGNVTYDFINRFGPYFVSPVIAGLDKISDTEYKPIVCTYDSIGYREHNGQFEVAGTGAELLYGVCETFYKPDLEPEELFEVISNSLLSALDRDSLSGWGAKVYILTPTELTVRSLKVRQD